MYMHTNKSVGLSVSWIHYRAHITPPAQLHLVPALTGGRPCEELEQSTDYSSVLG